MAHGNARQDTPGEALSDNLDRDIAARRQRLAELGYSQKRDERAFTDLRAQAERIRASIQGCRELLIADSRERTTLLAELDQLLQRRIQRENAAGGQVSPGGTAELLATDIMELNPVGPSLGAMPAGTSEWRLAAAPPPRPHAGPPPSAPAPLSGPRAPEPPNHLAVVPTPFVPEMGNSGDSGDSGDGVTQVTARPAAMRSAAFQPQARPLERPAAQSARPPAAPFAGPTRGLAAPRGTAEGPRVVAMAVEVELGGPHTVVGFTERLWEAGLLVTIAASGASRRVGDRLPLQFTLPGHHRAIACEAEVSRLGDTAHDVTLLFLDLNAHDQATLRRFIAQREPLNATV